MNSPLKQNTTTIQELLDAINNLPEAENLDTELSTQAILLSEQDAKIAELAQVLAGKASGSSTDAEDGLLMGTLTDYSNDRVTSIKNYAFYEDNITSVNFANCQEVGEYAFALSLNLKTANFPACTCIYEGAFDECMNLANINLPVCTSIGGNTFCYAAFESIILPTCKNIGPFAFLQCVNLSSVQLGSSNIDNDNDYGICDSAFAYCPNLTNVTLYYPFVIRLNDPSVFEGTPIAASDLTGSFGSIYVPASLVDEYKSAENWSEYADRITAIVE